MAKTPQRLIDYRAHKCRKEVYFSPQDMKEFERVAATEGEKVGVVIRNMALAYLQSRPLPSKEEQQRLDRLHEEVSQLSLLLRNIANNVNQIAHHSNTIKVLADEHGLLQHLKTLDELVRDTVENKIKGIN